MEEATLAADRMRVAAWARRELDHRPIERRRTGRRTFTPPSTMDSGIRSADRAAPAVPEPRPAPARSLATRRVQGPGFVLLAHRTEPSEVRPDSMDAASTAGVVGLVGVRDGAGEVGALASDGRIGDWVGDSPGIPGGMVLIGMAMVPTGIRQTPIIIPTTTATTGLTIRRRTDRIRHQKITHRETIRTRQAQLQITNTSESIPERA
jgi:hypothetical protein